MGVTLMPCLKVPNIPLPPGLSILLGLPTIVIPTPSVGVTLCCHFQTPPIPGSPFILPFGATPGISITLTPVLSLLSTYIALVNATLDLIAFDCPLNP